MHSRFVVKISFIFLSALITLASRPSFAQTVTNGLIRYNTSLNKFQAYQNNAWFDLINTAGASFPLLAPLGSVGAPSYAFSGDSNTGLFSSASGYLNLSTNGTERLHIDDWGDVGIGTTTAQARLHVFGGDYKLQLNGATWGVIIREDTSSNLFINVANNDRFYISNTGRVGLSSISPVAGLDINLTGTNSSLLVPRDTTANRPSAVNGMLRYNTNLSAFEVYQSSNWATLATVGGASFPLLANPIGTVGAPAYSFNGDANTGVWSPSAGILAASTDGTERMRIDTSGNVMIGTTTPSTMMGGVAARLTVGDGTTQQYFAVIGANAGTVVTQATSNSAGFELQNTNGTNGNFTHMAFRDASGGMIAKIAAVNLTQASDTGDLAFLTGNGGMGGVAEVMRVTNDRKVGIGTTAALAGAILDVRGTGVAFSSVLVPRETTALRPTTGLNGMIRYNTNTNAFEGYQFNGWSKFGGGLIGKLRYAGTTNCAWTTTSTAYTTYAADVDCPTATVTGAAVAPGTKIPAVTFNNLPPGDYEVVVSTQMYQNPNGSCRWQIYDGTNSSGAAQTNLNNESNSVIIGTFSYTTTQSTITFQPRALSIGGTATCYLVADEPGNFDFEIWLKRL